MTTKVDTKRPLSKPRTDGTGEVHRRAEVKKLLKESPLRNSIVCFGKVKSHDSKEPFGLCGYACVMQKVGNGGCSAEPRTAAKLAASELVIRTHPVSESGRNDPLN